MNGSNRIQRQSETFAYRVAADSGTPSWESQGAHDEDYSWDDGPTVPPTGSWYHVSKYDLPEGTKLIPGGGESQWEDWYLNEPNQSPERRIQWVWMEPDLEGASQWVDYERGSHTYEVMPSHDPLPWNGNGQHGYVANGATIIRKIDPEEVEAGWWDNKDVPQRQANSAPSSKDLAKEYTDGLYDEFHDWARSQEYVPVGFSKNDPLIANPNYTVPMGGPLTYWDNIEGFLKDRYPAAFRDYRYGEENAAPALDGHAMKMPTRYSPWPNRTYHPGYETGPEAMEKYGYDPRQVAAGMMYLHTKSHSYGREKYYERDINRLAEIFQKRQQMQRDYENNQSITAAYRLAMSAEELVKVATHRTAMPAAYLYHNTSSDNRDSILRDGLLPNYDQTAPEGEAEEHGGTYASSMVKPGSGGDWWRIDTTKLPHSPEDDWSGSPEDENENWYWIQGGVPPHALTLHQPGRESAHRTASSTT